MKVYGVATSTDDNQLSSPMGNTVYTDIQKAKDIMAEIVKGLSGTVSADGLTGTACEVPYQILPLDVDEDK